MEFWNWGLWTISYLSLYPLGTTLRYSENNEGLVGSLNLVKLCVACVNLNYDCKMSYSRKTCRYGGRSLDSHTSSLILLTLWKALVFISGTICLLFLLLKAVGTIKRATVCKWALKITNLSTVLRWYFCNICDWRAYILLKLHPTVSIHSSSLAVPAKISNPYSYNPFSVLAPSHLNSLWLF